MAKISSIFKRSRTVGVLTFYMVGEKNLVRKKSSLSRKRVLTSPQFARTRQFAGLMARASKIGSKIYNALPECWRQFWMYRAFTGEAMTMLKAGMGEDEIQSVLFEIYVKEVGSKMYEVGGKKPEKRIYRKKDAEYWNNKTAKASRRKARKELTLHYAGMLARASRIGSFVYRSVPVHERRYAMYKALTGFAMQMLREGVAEEEVKAILMKELRESEVVKYEVRGLVHKIGCTGRHKMHILPHMALINFMINKAITYATSPFFHPDNRSAPARPC